MNRVRARYSHGPEENPWHGMWPFQTPLQTHIDVPSAQAGSAANNVANSETAKYADLMATHIFMPIAIETAGS